MTELTLQKQFEMLQEQLEKYRGYHKMEQLAQRIEGDISRLITSAYLNLADANYLHEQKIGEKDHICFINAAFNSDRCLICGEKIEYPEGWKAKENQQELLSGGVIPSAQLVAEQKEN